MSLDNGYGPPTEHEIAVRCARPGCAGAVHVAAGNASDPARIQATLVASGWVSHPVTASWHCSVTCARDVSSTPSSHAVVDARDPRLMKASADAEAHHARLAGAAAAISPTQRHACSSPSCDTVLELPVDPARRARVIATNGFVQRAGKLWCSARCHLMTKPATDEPVAPATALYGSPSAAWPNNPRGRAVADKVAQEREAKLRNDATTQPKRAKGAH